MGKENRPPFADEEGEGQREELLPMSHREVARVVGLAPSGRRLKAFLQSWIWCMGDPEKY